MNFLKNPALWCYSGTIEYRNLSAANPRGQASLDDSLADNVLVKLFFGSYQALDVREGFLFLSAFSRPGGARWRGGFG